MPIVTPTPVTPLPTPPTTSDPGTFDARADATLLAQQAMVPQVNQLAAETYANALHAQDRAQVAQTSAAEAAASASASASSSASEKWVSGTGYTLGQVAWSPANFHAYRRRVAGAGTTDPSADPTNWEPQTGIRPAVSVVGVSTAANKFTLYVLTASLTLTLPASPVVGDWVTVQNSSGLGTCVIGRNTKNIMSLAEDMVIDARSVSLTLVYADATRGWVFA